MSTPKRSTSTKRFSIASSASQSRPSVHFDIETLISHPETIDSALKKRLSVASHSSYPPSSESRRDDHESRRRRHSIVLPPASCLKIDPSPKRDSSRSRRRHSIVLSPTKHPYVAPSPNIDPTKNDDSSRSRRRHSIVLSPTKHSWMTPSPNIDSSALQDDDSSRSRRRRSIVSSLTKHSVLPSYPKIDSTSNNDNSPAGRNFSIVPLFTATSVPDIQAGSKSPRKRRFSTISPPRHDPIHDLNASISSCKRRSSAVPEDKNEHDPFSRTKKLCTIAPSANLPPAQVCAEINQRIRSTFHYPDFDFIQHVQRRSYVVRTQHFKESECVTMLDTGVDELLQRMFEELSPQPDTNPNIDIRASPGKGLGMFSRKQISKGDAFFVEHPTVVTPYVIGLSVGLSELYADIFGKLSGPVFEELMDLSSSSSQTQGVHEAIMRINALAIELPVPSGEFSELNTHRAIFLQTSRCNHSCGPNARWEWDPKRFSLVLTSIQPIKEGEEITIPYVAPEMTSKERQGILSNFYGFKCSCSFCVLPSDNIQNGLSKMNSESISPSSLPLPSFEKWCLNPTYPDDILIDSHKRALQSIERENISDDDPARDIGKHLDAIAMCYGALEDVDNFRMWMERVSEVRSKAKPAQKLVFSRWLSNPTKFPVWGWRKVFCGEGEEVGDSDPDLSSCVSMGMFEGVS